MVKFCSLYSGSSGNCLYISDGNTKLLIDAGVSAKKVVEALHSIGEKPSELSAILVSHEHSDHTRGVGIISRKFNIPIYANESTWGMMEKEVGPVNVENRLYFSTGMEFELGNISVKTFSIPHDASDPVGFNFFVSGRKITTATDIGHITKSLLNNLYMSDLILLESNHDIEMLKVGPYPWNLKKRILGDMGHLSNEMAGKVVAHLAENGTKRFLLGHLSKENNFPELAYQTVFNALAEKKICVGIDVTLDVVLRDRAGNLIEF